jgi:tight adherence protein C
MTPAWGAVVAGVIAAGVLLIVSSLPVLNRPSLADRVLPYVMPTDPEALRWSGRGASVRLTELIGRAARGMDRWLGGRSGLENRLRRAGEPVEVETFRFDQVVKGFIGAGAGAALALLLSATRGAFRPGPMALLMVVGAVVGIIVHERALDARVRRREHLMVAQFPAVAEMLALSVAAGEGISGAIERVAERSSGPLAHDLSGVLAEARMGTGLVQALRALGDRTHVLPLSRFVDAVAVAIERGTPLAEVLRAQASDVRDAGRRSLMESAGRKEIAMMVPVVFLVLPVTVVFALFPGFFGLALDV